MKLNINIILHHVCDHFLEKKLNYINKSYIDIYISLFDNNTVI